MEFRADCAGVRIVDGEEVVAGFVGNVQRDSEGEGNPCQAKVPVQHGG